MNVQVQIRTISTTAHITIEQDGTAPLLVSRELVMDEDTDGSWLVYASSLRAWTTRARAWHRVRSGSRTRQGSNSLVISSGCLLTSPDRGQQAPGSYESNESPHRGKSILRRQYYVLIAGAKTQVSNVRGPFPTERAAIDHAEKQAEKFYGGDEVTWDESTGPGEYLVGHILGGGTRSGPLVRITVEDDETGPESM